MSRVSEQWSKASATSQGRTDANLANDSNNLGGIPAEDWATKKYVQDYHDGKEGNLKQYIDIQDASILEQAKEYTNSQIRNQDFSGFAEIQDLQALNDNLTEQITEGLTEQKNYTDSKTQAIVDDVNANFQDVENSISTLNGTVNDLFTSVSNGKSLIAGAITDKGVTTSATDSYSTMATNIRSIKTAGDIEIDPNFVNTADGNATENDIRLGKIAYVKGQKVYGALIPDEGIDTSDATATAADIRYGKTAYANGQKITGIMYSEDGGDTGYEPNPDNPYPTQVVTELIYADVDDGLEISNIQNISSSKYAISGDKRLLVIIDSANRKLKTYKRINGTYHQEVDQNNTLITPEYTFEELGISGSVSYITMGKMNSDENESSYETRIALSCSESTDSGINYVIYIFRISTYDGTMKTKNEKYIAGQNGADATFVKYNKWIIPAPVKTPEYVRWSPYSYTFVYQNRIIKLLDTTMGSEEDYSQTFEDLGELPGEYNYSICEGVQFLNNDRVIRSTYSRSNTYASEIAVFDENFNLLKSTRKNMVLSPDCLYGISGDNMYSVAINYTTGDISFQEIATIPYNISTYHTEETVITSSGKYLINFETGYDRVSIYQLDFKNGTCELYYKLDVGSLWIAPFTDVSSFPFLDTDIGNNLYLIEPITTEKNVIGVKYNGQTFYSSTYLTGVLTAKPEDVKAGKTFLGFNGIYEAGTMEV